MTKTYKSSQLCKPLRNVHFKRQTENKIAPYYFKKNVKTEQADSKRGTGLFCLCVPSGRMFQRVKVTNPPDSGKRQPKARAPSELLSIFMSISAIS